MTRSVLQILIAVIASQAAGCIITTGDDTNSNEHSVTMTWKLTTSATGLVATCPAGFPTAALFSQQVDDNDAAIGDPLIDLFDCSAGTGLRRRALAPALYDEWVEITNTDNTMQFARSKSNHDDNIQLDVTNSDQSYATEIVVDGGYFHLDVEPRRRGLERAADLR